MTESYCRGVNLIETWLLLIEASLVSLIIHRTISRLSWYLLKRIRKKPVQGLRGSPLMDNRSWLIRTSCSANQGMNMMVGSRAILRPSCFRGRLSTFHP